MRSGRAGVFPHSGWRQPPDWLRAGAQCRENSFPSGRDRGKNASEADMPLRRCRRCVVSWDVREERKECRSDVDSGSVCRGFLPLCNRKERPRVRCGFHSGSGCVRDTEWFPGKSGKSPLRFSRMHCICMRNIDVDGGIPPRAWTREGEQAGLVRKPGERSVSSRCPRAASCSLRSGSECSVMFPLLFSPFHLTVAPLPCGNSGNPLRRDRD